MSTEHRLLVSENIEVSVDERSCRYDLEVFHKKDEVFSTLADGLSSQQLEHLAVRLLYIASICSDDDVALLEKYNLPLNNNQMQTPLEL